jgi:hypothetical protein
MAHKKMGQASFVEAFLRPDVAANRRLERLERMIAWAPLAALVRNWLHHTLQPHPRYMSSIYSAMERISNVQVNYKVWKGNWFVISGSESTGIFFYDYCRLDGDRLFCYR